MPKVSVIIPAYNAEKYIEKCLLSLRSQSFMDFEVIVVDDGSIDKTCEIASRYARVIKSTKNLGEGAAKNLGAQEARGEILAFTDADVVLPKDWLAKIVKNMETHNVRCAGGGYCGSIGHSFMEMFAHLELTYRRKDIPEFVNTIVSNNFACYRDVFFEFGGFPEKYKVEDLRLSYQISKKYKVYWDKDNGVYHHFRGDLKGYLKQQYYFGRDTVWTYYTFPELITIKTHQGRSIYLEIIFIWGLLFTVFLKPLYSLIFIFSILTLNLRFLNFLHKEKLSVPKSMGLIFLRDIVAAASIIGGILLCIKETFSITKKQLKKEGAR